MFHELNIFSDWQKVKTVCGEIRPLNDRQRRVIDANRRALVRLIDPDKGIINRLYGQRCFNSQHKDRIECGVDKLDKVSKLLDVMRRRSVANFNKLTDALDTDGQPRLAQMLKQGGGGLS